MTQLKNDTQPVTPKLRFGVFEVDPRSGELRKHGVRIPLQPRPFQALVLLLQHANAVISREELQKNLWSPDVFVDFEHGLNTAIRKVRHALNDDADKPRFIETVGRVGYRFLATVELEYDPASIQTTAEAIPSPHSPSPGPLVRTTSQDEALDGSADPEDAHDAGVVMLEPTSSVFEKSNRWTRTRWILAASVLAAIILIAYLLRPPMPVLRVSRVTELTRGGGARRFEPVYTDGPRVYYQSTGVLAADWELRQVLLNGNEDTPVGIHSGKFHIRGLSPDDTEFVAISFDGDTVWRVPVAGRSPRRVGNLVADDIAWSHDGNWFAYARRSQLFLTNSAGTSSWRLMTAPDVSQEIRQVHWAPDDHRIRFEIINPGPGGNRVNPTTRTLWEIGPDGNNLHELRFNLPGNPMESSGDWTLDGRYFVFLSSREGISNLWVVEEKSDWWRRSNPDPTQLTSGPINYYQLVPSRNGRTIFAIGEQPSGELVRYEANRKVFVPFLDGQSFQWLTFSHNGQWVAYVTYPEGTLWRARSDGTDQLQLTFPPSRIEFPRWSANDERIAFHSIGSGQLFKCFVIAAAGGNPEPLPPDSFSQAAPDWMPGRDAVIYSRAVVAKNPALYLFDLGSGRSEQIAGTNGLYEPLWSPDGRHLLALDADADNSLLLLDLKTGKRSQIAGPVLWPAWSPDSQYIYFTKWGVDWIFRVHIPDGREEQVLQVPFRVAPWPFTVAPDGSLIFLRDHGRTDVYALSLSRP
jgi:DNA-binding winged helix-turn-helix (wHTH) protein/Tol biopolymer transport system component